MEQASVAYGVSVVRRARVQEALAFGADAHDRMVDACMQVTMPKDVTHFGGWENRDVHNVYGMLVHKYAHLPAKCN